MVAVVPRDKDIGMREQWLSARPEIAGVFFLHDRWFAAIITAGLLIGLTKERYILNKYARKAVIRIHERAGHPANELYELPIQV